MNRLKNIILLIALAFFVNTIVAQKIAHVSLDSVMATMPETKMARDEVQNYLKGLESEILVMQTELETKYKDYMEKRESMSEPVKQNKEQDLNQLQQRIEAFKAQAGQDIQKKQGDLGAPILHKAKKAIEAVAKEGGYKYVLNTSVSANTALYSEPSDDIFLLVKKKLESMPVNKSVGTNSPGKVPLKANEAPKKGK